MGSLYEQQCVHNFCTSVVRHTSGTFTVTGNGVALRTREVLGEISGETVIVNGKPVISKGKVV